MCGVAGLINFDGRPVGQELELMSNALRHRGPDQHGVWRHMHASQAIGLAHRRLSIHDLSVAGQQPMFSHGEKWIVTYNGELYNEHALAERLYATYGVSMRTACDTEVLLEAIAHQGAEAIRDFNGIFAFAAYDLTRGELLLARDAFGVKPLYLWRSADRRSMAFASEVKAFLALPAFTRSVDPGALASFLAQGYVGPERSLMVDVTSVALGQILRVDATGKLAELFRVSPLANTKRDARINLDDAAEWLLPHFEAAVTRQRASDVPLALWQSGGVDSALINAASGSPRPRALTVGNSHADFNESNEASAICEQLGTPMEVIHLEDSSEAAGTVFSDLVWHMDGELADSSALAVKKLSAATKRHATVVLSGDGADELFGGYATYQATRLAGRFGRAIPAQLSQPISRWLLGRTGSAVSRYPTLEFAGRFIRGLSQGHLAHAEWRRYAMPRDLERLTGSTNSEALRGYRAAIDAARIGDPAGGPAARGRASDIGYYLPGDMLMKVDRMSMAHGLEARVPFLDLEFVTRVAEVAAQTRLPHRGQTKPLLRRMLAKYGLPATITQRKKTGFNVPLAAELRSTYRGVLTQLLIDGDYVEPHLRVDHVRLLARQHLAGTANHAYLLWTLMTFAQWRMHLGR
ncbi:asparagine synthase (glutamine-hydrolyzing) [Devosia sp. A8/3-2]|nr:asparagine synthase (glutamine-hydrolyzing) [Devosia sp. A8/3-2]